MHDIGAKPLRQSDAELHRLKRQLIEESMAKAGRKPDEGTMRTASGRKSRSKESLGFAERLQLEAATWKRRQENPELTISEARLPEHGSVIARWLEDWNKAQKRQPEAAHAFMFTQMHYDTALRFHELHERWIALAGARQPRSSSDFSGPGGYDGSDPFETARAERDAKVQADFKSARRAILESGPLGMMAIETIVIENQPADSLRGDLRLALNALAVLWKLQAAA
ncbi:hypothetical protein QEZ48_19660 [Aquamicrobium lusatiense]|uniref:hypothetical protein n=1 Tax=Aquamicrobium lusatiense TaxID=89772 RepID=UPI002454C15C|nr:hypothetical protein [Aquamicrobium lusatiense]MDH4993035.1 hypothetical protein [Aquamicrobium lusatiense]